MHSNQIVHAQHPSAHPLLNRVNGVAGGLSFRKILATAARASFCLTALGMRQHLWPRVAVRPQFWRCVWHGWVTISAGCREANDPQQSWGFEGEPPEAVIKD